MKKLTLLWNKINYDFKIKYILAFKKNAIKTLRLNAITV